MQITSQTWRDLFAAGAALQARAVIAGTVYTDIGAPVINRALMQDSLAVGNVVSASLALALRSAGSIPRAAAVVIETRLNDGVTASEWLPQGTFYISRRMRDPVTGALALECYDALLKANAVWTPSAGAWPRTMAAVTAELAALLGVTLDSRTVIPSGAAFAVSEPAAGTTIRDVLSLIAQAAGGNWIMTPAGLMRLARLGEAGGAVDVAGVVGGIDVGAAGVVTGVRSTVDGVVTLTGNDTGIVLDVTVAPVIAAELAEAVIGQAWQPFRLSGAIYDPAAELGDGVRAGAGGEVASALCSEQAVYGPAFRGDIAAPDAGEVTDEYPYIGGAQRTLALAKAAVTEAVNRLDDELTQQEIFNRLTDDGAAQGLILYNGQLYINASYINAGRLNADYIQGGTLTLGGQNNQNGVLRVLDASGNVITVLNNVGADITDGSVTTYSTDRQTRTILSDGLLKFQYYNSSSQPVGWRDALRLAADPSGATIGTFAGTAELDISGRGRVNISNKEGTTDYDHAEIDMDDDTISLTATNIFDGWTSLEVTKDGVTVTRYDHIGDPRVIFELVDSYEQSDAPLTIGNGGTGATTAAGARANLDVPSTTGSGASGTWNINIPFSGNATGFKNFSLNAIDIDNTRGNWEAGFSERTNHGTFPAWGGWCHVAQYDCDHFLYQVANGFTASNVFCSEVLSLSVRSRWTGGPWGPWTDIFYSNGAVPVASGGTGATTILGAVQNLFSPDAGYITQYPDKPGIYWTASDIFAHMNPASPYGVLVIFKAAYGMHLYLDFYANLYVGYSGDTFGEPSTWRVVTSTVRT